MATKPNNATIVETCTRRVRSLGSYVGSGAKIAVNGRKLTREDVVATYRSCLDARATVARLRAQLESALVTVAETEAARLEADTALRAWVRAEFGVESTEAIDFGFPPPRKPKLTVEEKALAVARTKATRAARRTMGKRQKEGIRGAVVAPSPPRLTATATATVEAEKEEEKPHVAETPPATGERPWLQVSLE